jgi:hypothetical protein
MMAAQAYIEARPHMQELNHKDNFLLHIDD